MPDEKKKDWFTDMILKKYGVSDESELLEKYGLKILSKGWGPFYQKLLVKADGTGPQTWKDYKKLSKNPNKIINGK